MDGTEIHADPTLLPTAPTPDVTPRVGTGMVLGPQDRAAHLPLTGCPDDGAADWTARPTKPARRLLPLRTARCSRRR